MITTLHRSVNHPNAYRWPQQEVKSLPEVDSVNAELRSQIEILNQQVEGLYQSVQSLLYKA
jgi:hypothetical protein